MTAAKLLKSCSAIALAVGASVALLPTTASAQTWTGAVNDDYANPANWDGGQLPQSSGRTEIRTNINAPVIGADDDVEGGNLTIGESSTGTLTVRDGGQLRVGELVGVGGHPLRGSSAGDGTLLVTGAGSLLSLPTNLFFVAPNNGTRGVVTVADGGTIRSIGATIGLGVGSQANVTVTGTGSLFDLGSTGSLQLGGVGGVNLPDEVSLNILDGGRVTSTSTAQHSTNQNSLLRISGAGSVLSLASGIDIDGNLLIEESGSAVIGGSSTFGRTAGASLTVRTGGQLETLSNANPIVFNERSHVLITGAGSRFTSGQAIVVNARADAVNPVFDFVVDDRATLNTPSLTIGTEGVGAVTVRGGAVLNVDPNALGLALVVGGTASNAATAINAARFGNGTLTITGADSRVNATTLLVGRGASTRGVAEGGASGVIEVLNGGALRVSRDADIGAANVGATNNGRGILRVSGAGSTLEIGATNTIQVRNPGSLIEILDGGRVVPIEAPNLLITREAGMRISGAGTDANFGNSINVQTQTATLAGAGLLVENNGILRVSDLSTSVSITVNTFNNVGSVLVRSGGQVFADAIGINSGSLITIDGGQLNVTGSISVGNQFGSSNNQLILRNGASVNASSLSTVLENSAIFFGGVDADGPSAIGAYDVRTLNISGGSRALFNHNGGQLTINSDIGGAGLIQHVAGDTRFTGTSSDFSGLMELSGGHLRIDGVLGISASTVAVSGGATLSGSGRIGGALNVGAGTIAAGGQPVQGGEETFGRSAPPPNDAVGLLTIDGALSLTADTFLLYQLGVPGGQSGLDSDLINVGGNLTLDGTLDVVDVGGFGGGLYRLINYGGALTDNGLDIGLTPTGFAAADVAVQTSVAQQVNLIVAAAPPLANSFTFWDGPNMSANGTIDGGSGTWTSAGTNWSIADGSTNGVYDRSQLLIFAGTGGAVAVDNADSPVTLENGVQFAAGGYTVAGGNIVLDDDNVNQVIFRVGDGTQVGAAFTATIGSALTGGAGLQKTDLGTLVLTGGNSYTGGTNIVNGTIRGNATSIQGNVRLEDEGTLVFDQASDGIYDGIFSGSGVVRSRGAGVLGITGASDAYAGMTIVEAGALRLTGALGGLTTIGAAGTLTGNGTLAQLDILGRVSPGGASIATLTVDDLNINQEAGLPANGTAARGLVAAAVEASPNIVFRAGSIFAVDLAASGATDRIDATGTATLEGGTVAITTLDADLAYTDGTIFRILNAEGGLTGTFAGLTESSAFLDFALGYDPTGAFLTLSQVRMFPDVALTINQKAAASALGTLVRPVGSDGLAVYNAVLGLDEDAARAAFDASSGEIYASLLAARQRQGFALTSRFTSRAQADFSEGLGVWGGITGHDGRIDADSDRNAGRVSSDGIGGELGLDYRGGDNGWAAGFGGGWQDGNVNLPERASYAKNKTWHIGGYLRMGTGGPGFTALATVVHAEADTDITRSIGFGTIARSASSTTDISTTALGVDARYGWGLGNWSLGPAATAGWATSRFSAFSETGAGALNLTGAGNRDKLTRYGIGGFTRYSGAKGYVDLTAYYVPGDRDDARATLSMAGSLQAFTVLAPRGSKSSFRLSASSQYDITESLSLSGNVGVDRGSDERDVYGHVRLSYRF